MQSVPYPPPLLKLHRPIKAKAIEVQAKHLPIQALWHTAPPDCYGFSLKATTQPSDSPPAGSA